MMVAPIVNLDSTLGAHGKPRMNRYRSMSSSEESTGSVKSVGFDLKSNTVRHRKNARSMDTWYTLYEMDNMRNDFNRVVRRVKKGQKEMKNHPHRGTESREEGRKHKMNESKKAVLKNQDKMEPEDLADIYRNHTECSEEKAIQLAAQDEDFVKGIADEVPKEPTKMKKLLRKLSSF